MSDRTQCNHCDLEDMKRRAKKRGVKVIVEAGSGEWKGWTLARYSDQSKPSAYFMKLTKRCVC